MRILFFWVCCCLALASNCSKKDKAITSTIAINNQLQSSTWAVHLLAAGAIDYTSLYAGFNFSFGQDSIFANTSRHDTGRWYLQDQPNGRVQLVVSQLPVQEKLLNNTWLIERNDGTLLVLKDALPAADKELHFIRQ